MRLLVPWGACTENICTGSSVCMRCRVVKAEIRMSTAAAAENRSQRRRARIRFSRRSIFPLSRASERRTSADGTCRCFHSRSHSRIRAAFSGEAARNPKSSHSSSGAMTASSFRLSFMGSVVVRIHTYNNRGGFYPPPVPEKFAYFLKFASGRLQDGWFISQARISICR